MKKTQTIHDTKNVVAKEKLLIFVGATAESAKFAQAVLSAQDTESYILYVTKNSNMLSDIKTLYHLQELAECGIRYGAQIHFCCQENEADYVEAFAKSHGITKIVAEPTTQHNVVQVLLQRLYQLFPQESVYCFS